MDWTALFTTLGSTAIIVGAVGWVARAGIQQWMARSLEVHRRDLRAAGEQELERLRQTLRLEESRQSRLIERQARIIAGVYARLERMHGALARLASLVHPADVDMEKLRREAAGAYNQFAAYYFERAIWLDVDTCNAINKLSEHCRMWLFDLSFEVDANGFPADHQAWQKAYSELRDELPKARKLLDTRFRQILGIVQAPRSEEPTSEA